METIHVVTRGQEILAKMQEEMNQRDKVVNPLISLVVETLIPSPPQVDPSVHIGALDSVPQVNLHPLVIEIDNQYYAFFRPRAASQYDIFGPVTNEVEKKVRDIDEKLKEMETTDASSLGAAEMCLAPGVVIPVKFKCPDFEKYKGNSNVRTHIKAYCRKMVAYSNDDRILMHFF